MVQVCAAEGSRRGRDQRWRKGLQVEEKTLGLDVRKITGDYKLR